MNSSLVFRTPSVLIAALFALLLSAPAAAEEPVPEPEPEARVEYTERGLQVSYGKNYALRLAGFVQTRFEFLREETADSSESSSRFTLHRARTVQAGHVFSPNIRYFIQTEWGRGSVDLLDATITFVLDPTWFSIEIGQARKRTSRQYRTGILVQTMVDRASTQAAFNSQRDVGITFHNGTRGMFEYVLALVNGTTAKSRVSGQVQVDPATGEGEILSARKSNVPGEFKPGAVVRLGFNWVSDEGCDALEKTDPGAVANVCRPSGYVEGDIHDANWQFGIGASGYGELDLDENDTTELLASVDTYFKGKGFWFTVAGHFQRITIDTADTQHIDKLGLHANTSYSFHTGSVILQPGLAYTWIDEEGEGNVVQEIGGALNVLVFGHHMKVQTDAMAIINETDPNTDSTIDARVRVQAQLRF